MKWLIVVAACLVAFASASPLKESGNSTVVGQNATLPESGKNKTEPVGLAGNHTVIRREAVNSTVAKNETLIQPNKTEPHGHRVRRDCGVADLTKIQDKLTFAIEKEIAKLLKGELVPTANRSRRAAATSAAAGSIATPDGKVKSTAVTSGNSSGDLPANGGGSGGIKKALEPSNEGHVDLSPPLSGGSSGNDSHPVLTPPSSGNSSAGGSGSGEAAHPAGDLSHTVQKVLASASKENGTAVAKAKAKRAVKQDVTSAGNKAVGIAESSKGGAAHSQNVLAQGNETGIATASIDGKNNNTRGGGEHDVSIQNVNASGNKAVASASKKTDGGISSQDAIAVGGETAIATTEVGSDEAKPEAGHKHVKRNTCLPTEINDEMRLHIRILLQNAFADVKKELLSQ